MLNKRRARVTVARLVTRNGMFARGSLFSTSTIFPGGRTRTVVVTFGRGRNGTVAIVRGTHMFGHLRSRNVRLVRVIGGANRSGSIVYGSIGLLRNSSRLVRLIRSGGVDTAHTHGFVGGRNSAGTARCTLTSVNLHARPISRRPMGARTISSSGGRPAQLTTGIRTPRNMAHTHNKLHRGGLTGNGVSRVRSLVGCVSAHVSTSKGVRLPRTVVGGIGSLTSTMRGGSRRGTHTLRTRGTLTRWLAVLSGGPLVIRQLFFIYFSRGWLTRI